MEEQLLFNKKWLEMKKYDFKIISMITMLADNQGKYIGKISELCKNLSVNPSAANVNKIKKSLEFLEKEGYINITIDKNLYTISLPTKAEMNGEIISVKRKWIELIKEAKSDTSWENMLKIFLVILEITQEKGKREKTVTYNEIGEMVKCSKATVERAIKTICGIDFEDFIIMKDVIKEKTEWGYMGIGSIYIRGINFE